MALQILLLFIEKVLSDRWFDAIVCITFSPWLIKVNEKLTVLFIRCSQMFALFHGFISIPCQNEYDNDKQ